MVENLSGHFYFPSKEKCVKEDDIGPIDFIEYEQPRSNCVIESTKKITGKKQKW